MTAVFPLLNSNVPFSGIIKLYSFPEYFRNRGSFTTPDRFRSVLMSIEHSESLLLVRYFKKEHL